jgi:predicted ATPase
VQSVDPNQRAKAQIKQHYSMLDDVKCLYIWGHPGSGKSFISDLLYDTLDVQDASMKKRAHYNEFMLQVHQMEH